MNTRNTTTLVPPTPAEVAAASATWDRRGLFGLLVRRIAPGRAEPTGPSGD